MLHSLFKLLPQKIPKEQAYCQKLLSFITNILDLLPFHSTIINTIVYLFLSRIYMSSSKPVRVRFAPSPTGMMHLGNVRAALMNYLFAKQKKGTFILRIEDTDTERNYDPQGVKIIDDLLWLGLDYQEGPIKGGHYEPYFQSKRNDIYKEKLTVLEHRNLVYRCFCTVEELEKKRQRQLALKLPPRYDRSCLKFSSQEIEQKLAAKVPFIWRFKLNQDETITIHDLARGAMTFDFQHFSDFALTRNDGSFTFMFANFVDDMVMVISHVIRGEDHLTNTAGQAALYKAFGIDLPIFWHLPIIGNAQGQKLSKRDFGFSLNDLRQAGYLPEAICNYLAIIGGGTFEKEVMNLSQLADAIDFDHMKPTGQIRYDVEKLRWLNHKWITTLQDNDLVYRCMQFLAPVYPQVTQLSAEKIQQLITTVKNDLNILSDIHSVLAFYFEKPVVDEQTLAQTLSVTEMNKIVAIIQQHTASIDNPKEFVEKLKSDAKQQNIANKHLFAFIRLVLTGSTHGLALHDIISILGTTETMQRLSSYL